MKPWTPRKIRVFFSLLAGIVLVLTLANFYEMMFIRAATNDMCGWVPSENNPDKYVISMVIEDGVTYKAGVRVGDTLVSINGVAINRKQPGFIIQDAKAGETMTYRLKRGESVYTAKVEVVKSPNIPYLGLFLLGFGFLIVAWVVLMAKPEGKIQRYFARYSIIAMAYFGFSSTYLNLGNPDAYDIFRIMLITTAHVFAIVHFILFFCQFPIEKRIARNKWFQPALFVLAIVITGGTIALFYGWPLPRESSLSPVLRNLGWSFPMIAYFIGLGIFAHSYFRRIEKIARKKLRHIVYATIIGAIAIGYLVFVSNTAPLRFVFYPVLAVPVLLMAGVPVAFGYSIIRYRLMDVDLIIKRSLIYGIVTATIAAIYLLFVIGIGNIVTGLFETSENELLTVIAIVVIAFLFDPIKRMVQEWVDKVFYQDRYNYQKALLEFSRELPSNTDLQHILSSMVSRISQTMHVDKAAVFLCHEQEGCRDASMNMETSDMHFSAENDGLASWLQAARTPLSLVIPTEEWNALPINDHDKALLTGNQIELVVPMFYKDELLGTVLVGAKLSGKLFSQEDIDLLSTVASQAAIAIENARLLRDEVDRQKMVEELNIARRIQLGLLPAGDPQIPGLDISGVSIPAQSVGGDYFDYIVIGPNKILVVVADVSGKGIPAALYMSKVQGMIRIAAGQHESPRDILIHVNRYIHQRLERNAFITIALAMFDMEERTVTMCRAGHTKPLVADADGSRFISPKGMGLGLEDGPTFEENLEEETLPLTSGATFIIYSDGLTESMDARHEEFGEHRLSNAIAALNGEDARSIQDNIVESAMAFAQSVPQHDDLTLVVVRVKA